MAALPAIDAELEAAPLTWDEIQAANLRDAMARRLRMNNAQYSEYLYRQARKAKHPRSRAVKDRKNMQARERRKADPEKARARRHAWYLENRERIRTRQQEYRAENAETIRATAKYSAARRRAAQKAAKLAAQEPA